MHFYMWKFALCYSDCFVYATNYGDTKPEGSAAKLLSLWAWQVNAQAAGYTQISDSTATCTFKSMHTQRTHVLLRCMLLTSSHSPLLRVVLQLSRTRIPSLFSLWHTPSVSHTLISSWSLQLRMQACRCLYPLFSSLLPFFPLTPLFSSLSLFGAERQSSFTEPWGRASLSIFSPPSAGLFKNEEARKRRNKCRLKWPNRCATSGLQPSAGVQPPWGHWTHLALLFPKNNRNRNKR